MECTLCQCVAVVGKDTEKAIPSSREFNGEEVRVLPKLPKDDVLFVTVATHREPYIELLEQSARSLNIDIEILGLGEFFKGAI